MIGVEEYAAGCGCVTLVVGLFSVMALFAGDWGLLGTLLPIFIFLLVIVVMMFNSMKSM